MLMTTSLRYWLDFSALCTLMDSSHGRCRRRCKRLADRQSHPRNNTLPRTILLQRRHLRVLLAVAVHELAGMHVTSPPFLPDFSHMNFDNYLGRELPITEADRQFYGDNDIEKYFFAGDTSAIHVLAVHCGDDVHQIHPPSHCLRTSGGNILDEKSQHISVNSNNLAVNEIVAVQNTQQILLWVWYSNDEQSTASFLNFRRLWTPSRPWVAFQLLTDLDDGLEAARQRLHDLLSLKALND